MSGENRRGIADNEAVLIAFLLAAIVLVLAFAWWAASPAIGFLYKWVRAVQTLGLWPFLSDWGRYFFSVPAGDPFVFRSIFQSSVAFNVFNAFAIAGLGWLAYRKVTTEHINAHIKSEKPRNWRDIMEKQSWNWPDNKFFLLYSLPEYPVSHGPGRLPPTALELLLECDGIIGIYDDEHRSGWKIDEERVTEKLISCFGPENPFSHSGFRFSDRSMVTAAVAGLPWHQVVIMAACLERMYAQALLDEDTFKKVQGTVNDKLKDIWRQFIKDKQRMGDRLTLGFVDDSDRAIKIAAAQEKMPGCRVYTFAEYLDELVPVDGASVPRVETYDFVVAARAYMTSLLTEYLDMNPDRRTNIEIRKGVYKTLRNLSGLEKAQFARFEKQRYEFVTETVIPALVKHGYLFGVTATLLARTRKGGVFPPNYFRWMRFYDFDLWSFLRVQGMNTPTPNVAGMFDHYQVEEKNGSPLARPYLTSAVEAIRIEASKYLTDDMRAKYRVIKSHRTARQKSQQAARLIATALRDQLQQLQQGNMSGDPSEDGSDGW